MSFFPQGSFFGIGLIGKSLDAFQLAENVVSNNIANVNTPGASRQQTQFTQAPPIVGSTGYAAHVGGTVGDGHDIRASIRIRTACFAARRRPELLQRAERRSALQSTFGVELGRGRSSRLPDGHQPDRNSR